MLKKAKVIYYLSDKSYFSQVSLVNHIKNSDVKFISKEEESIEHFVSFLPPGTIFAKSYGIEEKNNILCLPLISLHFSLPVKQGELIWYFSDDDLKKDRLNAKELFDYHPLLAINDYWLSRIHGTLLSEDLNYSFKERDELVLNKKILNKDLSENNKNIAILPSFETKNIFISNEDNTEFINTKSLYEKGLGSHFGDKAVPRMFSKSDDLTLQGSYNTLINFTSSNTNLSKSDSREGLIDIVAGRLSLQNFTENEDTINFKKTIRNLPNLNNSVIEKEFNIPYNKFVEIKNTSGGEELFKSPSLYLNEDIDFANTIEDKIDYTSDASRILLSESIEIDNGFYYDNKFLEKTNYFYDYFSFIETEVEKDYLKDVIKIKNIVNEEFNTFSMDKNYNMISMPTILLKTNNIRIVSRKELKNNNNDTNMPSGNIRIIKEDNNFLNYSQILMENDGNILLEGNLIKIGDFRKEFMKLNNIKTLDDFEISLFNKDYSLEANDEKVKSMHGKGNGVLLGYEEKLSEPLVLGNTLVEILKEIININTEALENIKVLSEEQKKDNQSILKFSVAVQSSLSALGFPIPPLTIESLPKYDKIKSATDDEITRLSKIKNNLSDILSRFSKTS